MKFFLDQKIYCFSFQTFHPQMISCSRLKLVGFCSFGGIYKAFSHCYYTIHVVILYQLIKACYNHTLLAALWHCHCLTVLSVSVYCLFNIVCIDRHTQADTGQSTVTLHLYLRQPARGQPYDPRQKHGEQTNSTKLTELQSHKLFTSLWSFHINQ